jgi:hypothetical protein
MAAIAFVAAPRREWTDSRAALVGVSVGLAAATKLALLPTIGVVTVVAAAVMLTDRRTRAGTLRRLGYFAVGALVVVAPWWIRNSVREGNPFFPQSLPILGRGVNVGAKGAFDTEYVPRTAAWPLYSFFEPIDDRSGFGPVFAIGALAGLAFAFGRARRRPLLVLAAAFVVTLPFWWWFTVHEPRYLLPIAGLSLAGLPWALAAARGRARTVAAGLVAVAAVFSLALIIDQEIAPLAVQPMDRGAFYSRLFAVDPVAVTLPETDGLLQVTGFGNARVDYASTYPLLGEGQQRRLVTIDRAAIRGTDDIVRRMEGAHMRYAYVSAVTAEQARVEALFPSTRFRLVGSSAVTVSGGIGARRPLFAPASDDASADTVRRYLYELKSAGP